MRLTVKLCKFFAGEDKEVQKACYKLEGQNLYIEKTHHHEF